MPAQYPAVAPYVYLDEPVNANVIELLDYIDNHNRVRCEFLSHWPARATEAAWKPKLNLNHLLYEVYQLYKACPPLSFEEM